MQFERSLTEPVDDTQDFDLVMVPAPQVTEHPDHWPYLRVCTTGEAVEETPHPVGQQ
jgi:hypothetical protein